MCSECAAIGEPRKNVQLDTGLIAESASMNKQQPFVAGKGRPMSKQRKTDGHRSG